MAYQLNTTQYIAMLLLVVEIWQIQIWWSRIIRTVLGNASVYKTQKQGGLPKEDKSWFKRVDRGQKLGEIICADFENPVESKIYEQLNTIRGWLLL